MPVALLAVAGAALLSWWSWRGRLTGRAAVLGAACRAAAITALLLLLFDPAVRARSPLSRPIVLLDHSLSMRVANPHAADSLAGSLGDTVAFGELAAGLPGGRSLLATALDAALATGRPVDVVTDGEIDDAADIAPDLLAETTVRVAPHPAAPDIAVTTVDGAHRLSAGDTLVLRVGVQRTAGAPDTATVEVRRDSARLAVTTAHFGGSARTIVTLRIVLPASARGIEWLDVLRAGAPDAVAGDDLRWWPLEVTPTPGIVVVAETPDWDARFLYEALRDVANAPVRGYAQLTRGAWRRMDDLAPVSAATVVAAARAADLVAVHGDIANWKTLGKARLLWPAAANAGDWYLAPSGLSPVAGAFAGVDADSLPPATAVTPLSSNAAWVGVVARQGRRGGAVPVVTGDTTAGRSVSIGAAGLFRWGFRGGVTEQVWRALIAEVAAWLLTGPESETAAAQPVAMVTQQGLPVRFRWTGSGSPQALAIHLDGVGTDTLRFDGTGEAQLDLTVGRYHYTLDHGGAGSFGVEPYSDEFVPGPVTLPARQASVAAVGARRPLRDWLWLFGVVVAGFAADWTLRRRAGMQ